ncbi:M61 family metallopeptidase [Stakelama tenebrarum]|uniref:M61 family metallopeptidase n=1 Tax=Stakelama tenebrarum TaxID=2711215 RepID=A0A6G6Y952_9SPHN|nr:PDZ domain-containing protein [Sphingosinithalassobacter tenebrarum]QIG81440.1 M61 family metallopeptidase [Sphingosinithalassobacter tenebrarum]
MRAMLTSVSVLALFATPALAQTGHNAPPVEYSVDLSNAAHHEARITVTYSGLDDAPITFRMSRSSPGRYAIHEFAKNVYSVSATNGDGEPLSITRTDPYSWTVAEHGETVALTYTLYADHGDGTYSQIDPTHAHFNMPSAFMWAEGYDQRPLHVTYEGFDPSWKVATQMPPVEGETATFMAPNLQYFMDSPTELSDFMLREWKIPGGEDGYTIRLAIHHQGSAAEADRFAEMAQKVVAEQVAIWGAPAAYDYGTYTFIADYVPWIDGDGMEHRNSTILTMPRGLAEAGYGQIGTLSHEFFHSWNVERLRPAELEPFDFTRANPTPSLWFAEGFTSYYGPLTLRRSGIWDTDQLLRGLAGTLNYVIHGPGRDYAGPAEMSLRAPFVDAATAIDEANPNIFTSYYPYGAVIALALDLEIRDEYPGKTLDGYMRHMWAEHGSVDRAYTLDDLREGLGEYLGAPAFADDVFAKSIHAGALPDLKPLLAQAGILLAPENPERPYIGSTKFDERGGGLLLARSPAPETPLYEAGLDRGDVILSIDGQTVDSTSALTAAVLATAPGDVVTVIYRTRDGAEKQSEMTIGADPSFKVVRYEEAGMTPSAEELAFRKAWLGE